MHQFSVLLKSVVGAAQAFITISKSQYSGCLFLRAELPDPHMSKTRQVYNYIDIYDMQLFKYAI